MRRAHVLLYDLCRYFRRLELHQAGYLAMISRRSVEIIRTISFVALFGDKSAHVSSQRSSIWSFEFGWVSQSKFLQYFFRKVFLFRGRLYQGQSSDESSLLDILFHHLSMLKLSCFDIQVQILKK